VVSVLDSGAEGPGIKLQLWRCHVTVLGKLFTPIVPVFSEIGTSLWAVKVTLGLAESNGSLLPRLWLTSSAGWLPRTGISSRTLCSAVNMGYLYLFTYTWLNKTASDAVGFKLPSLCVWWLCICDWSLFSCWSSRTQAVVRIALGLRWRQPSFSCSPSLSTNWATSPVAWWVVDMTRYDTRCCFNMCPEADTSRLSIYVYIFIRIKCSSRTRKILLLLYTCNV